MEDIIKEEKEAELANEMFDAKRDAWICNNHENLVTEFIEEFSDGFNLLNQEVYILKLLV